jgi:hypothetical protein
MDGMRLKIQVDYKNGISVPRKSTKELQVSNSRSDAVLTALLDGGELSRDGFVYLFSFRALTESHADFGL